MIITITAESKDKSLEELVLDMVLRCLVRLKSDFKDGVTIGYSVEGAQK